VLVVGLGGVYWFFSLFCISGFIFLDRRVKYLFVGFENVYTLGINHCFFSYLTAPHLDLDYHAEI
jgi:hypothetical protein